MLRELKTVSQSEIKELIAKRLQNPEEYTGKPLIIWRSDFYDGIQERILEEVFDDHNKDKTKETRKWFRTTQLGLGTPQVYNLTEEIVVHEGDPIDNYIGYDFGLLAVCPQFVSIDYRTNPASLSQYHSIINNREWEGIKVAAGVPIVAYMDNTSEWFETSEAYPNAEQYIFEPDFEEWAQWATKTETIPTPIIDFIRGDNTKDGITYRWYNYFRNLNPGPDYRCGCFYPERWRVAKVQLNVRLEDRELEKFSDLDDEDFRLAMPSGISPDLWDDFHRYLKENNL